MNRKEVKEFLETLHFHGYIDHDITKLDNLIDDYYPKQLNKPDVSGSDMQYCICSTECLGCYHKDAKCKKLRGHYR